MAYFKRFSIWQLLLVLMSLPTMLALVGVLTAWLDIDLSVLSHLFEFVIPNAVLNTLALVLCVALATVVIAVISAWLTTVCDFPGRAFFSWALILPMAIPGYVMAFALVGALEYTGSFQTYLRESFSLSLLLPDIYSFGGVVLALSLTLYPYTYLLVKNAFQTQGKQSLEVGQSLGLSTLQSFWRVSLPQARPWIVGGSLLVMMETLADFGTVSVFNYDTLTTAIYKSWFSLFSFQSALQIASLLLLFVVVVSLLERQSRHKQRFTNSRNTVQARTRILLPSLHAYFACAFCGVIFFIGFVLPIGQLLLWAIPHLSLEITDQFWRYMLGSFSLSLLAMTIITAFALLLAFAARTQNSYLANWTVKISTLGYALPGTVLAVGLLAPIAAIDHYLARLGFATPLLQGSMVVMLLAYSVRFMAVAFSPIENNLMRVTPSIDAVSRSLSVSGLSMLRRVHFPMIRVGVLTAMVLVFVDVMKELPITLMTRPFGFNTLAVRIYELSSEGLWQRAALPALAIVLVGLIPVVILILRADKVQQ